MLEILGHLDVFGAHFFADPARDKLTHVQRRGKLLSASNDSQDGSPDRDDLLNGSGRIRPCPVDTQHIQQLQKIVKIVDSIPMPTQPTYVT